MVCLLFISTASHLQQNSNCLLFVTLNIFIKNCSLSCVITLNISLYFDDRHIIGYVKLQVGPLLRSEHASASVKTICHVNYLIPRISIIASLGDKR